tara:strand:- start:324 stop:1118 length:795 start_codon:yes stop_codon:yes gene_type:complete
MKSKKIIITGHKSFIAKRFIEIAENKNIETINYSNIKNKKNLSKISCFIHFSFQKKIKTKINLFFKKNLDRTYEIIEFCNRNNIKLIFISSSSYAPSQIKSKETHNTFSYNLYSMTKLICEEKIKKKSKKYVILRLTNIFGKNGHSFAEKLIKIVKSKKNIVNEDKHLVRDFLYIDDFCEILIKVLFMKKINLILNIGSGKPTKIFSIYKSLKAKKLISKLVFQGNNYTPKRNFFVANISRLRKYIKYEPKTKLLNYLINELSN